MFINRNGAGLRRLPNIFSDGSTKGCLETETGRADHPGFTIRIIF
ncbi:hypothetical protein HMPREF9123_0525 [Neisseria bacilliformis ATCC BAA-1200]|uniref:Uncharacterized protein n=1 Tax=Neisseria bacilliformis ATCC BAA-1200 TaxID=888742 RepID=F2B9Z6_9NEIS|nr:hypothetical protein HMPREF9123_0525 [Neisseria bacilliformis ATCC BAA-1200]